MHIPLHLCIFQPVFAIVILIARIPDNKHYCIQSAGQVYKDNFTVRRHAQQDTAAHSLNAAMLCKTLLFGLAACASSSLARPTDGRGKLHRIPEQDQTPQRYLSSGTSHPWSLHRQSPTYSPGHLEAAPNSIGLLFTTPDEEEVTHVWLPLGRKIFTRT